MDGGQVEKMKKRWIVSLPDRNKKHRVSKKNVVVTLPHTERERVG